MVLVLVCSEHFMRGITSILQEKTNLMRLNRPSLNGSAITFFHYILEKEYSIDCE